jgi:competence protein ComEC
MTSSKILFYLSISFITGIFISSIVKIPHIFLWGFLFLGVSIIIFAEISSFFYFGLAVGLAGVKKTAYLCLGFCLLFLVLGILRMQISEFNITNNKLNKFNGTGEITMAGEIFKEPDVRDNSQKLKVRVSNVTSNVTPNVTEGIVLITTSRYPEYNYLDKIKITGKLETPSETEDFSYKNYLMKDGIYSVVNFPKIQLISKEHNHNVFSYLYEKILFLKQKLRESIRNNFSPPESSILEGTILGDNGVMSQDLKNKLNITGLRHIIAVSGSHIVILSSIVMSLLLFLGLWRRQAFYFTVIIIFVYIVLTGLPASGVRAGIMGTIYLLAQKIGRQSASSRIIVLACGLMLLFNPLLLFYDIGFQLSFMAVLGIIYFDPLMRKFFKFLIKKFFNKEIKEKYENLSSIVSATISAQIFTLPIIVFNFGNVSWVSPITNILVLPVVYYLMIFGFLSSVTGIFSGILGWVLSVPCYILLSYFLWVVDLFSKPWMYKTIENISWIWLAVSYFIIAFATRFLNKIYIQKF